MTNTLNCHALALKEADTLTIATGVVTATQEYHVIAAESGTTDTLDTILLGYTNLSVKGNTYRPCLRLIADSGDTITLSHGTGNLILPDGSNITLSDDAFVWLLWRGSAWYAMGTVGSAGSVTSNDVTMDVLDTPTYTTLQDWSDTTQSAGLITGGTITDNGDGTCAVAAGTGIIKATDSNVGNNLFFDFDADASVTLTDESDNWVYVDYNGGTPIVDAVADWTTLDLHTQILVGKVYREGTELHIVPAAQYIDDFQRRIMQRFWEVEMVKRASGLILADAGTLHFEFTAGVLYAALGRLAIAAFDTTGADRFTYMYRDGGGGWTEVAAQAVIDNAYWDDGTGVLNTLTALRYGVHWVYVGHDGDVYVQYGQGDYILAQALAALVPEPPPELTAIATLVGKIIAQQGDTELYNVLSAFQQAFEGTTATDHGSLAGLADDDHTQYALLAGRTPGQTLIGGTGAGDDLTLQTTSNGTKGSYILSELTTLGLVQNSAAGVLSSLALGNAYEVVRVNSGATAFEVAEAVPFNYREGLGIHYYSAAEILIDTGSVIVAGAMVKKDTSTLLNLGTAAHWVNGSSTEAASQWISVYCNPAGDLRLASVLPAYPLADLSTAVTTMIVNQAGWDGTAGQGLNATSVVYDNDSGGEGSVAAGMFAVIYDNLASWIGRGKGSGAAASVANLSIARITAINTGTSTLTLEAGHQIAINDDDYILVVPAGKPLYYPSPPNIWRWLGAFWNDASSNLTEDANGSANHRNDGSVYSTSSTTPVQISSAYTIRLVITEKPVEAGFFCTMGGSTYVAGFVLEIDGSFYPASSPPPYLVTSYQTRTAVSFVMPLDLLPGSHTFDIFWRSSSGAVYIENTGAAADYRSTPHFYVHEVG